MVKFNVWPWTVTFIMCLSLNSIAVTESTCEFSTQKYTSELSKKNRVPLFVSRDQFSTDTKDFLENLYQNKRKKFFKAIKEAPLRCPSEVAKAQTIVKKLLKNSEAAGLNNVKLDVVVLCTKEKMPPIARLMAGKLLLLPISLFQKSKSEDHMAAVIAHEIAHLALFHYGRLRQTISDSNFKISQLDVSEIKKIHEDEADLTSLELLASAGYDPIKAVEHLTHVHALKDKKIEHSNKLATHRVFESRLAFLNTQISNCY